MKRSAALALVVLLGLPGWARAFDNSTNMNADPNFDPDGELAVHRSNGVAASTLDGFFECKDLSDGNKVKLRETTHHVLVNDDMTHPGVCVSALYFDNEENLLSCANIELTREDLHQYNVCKYLAEFQLLPDGTYGTGQPPATGHVMYFLAQSDGVPDLNDPDPTAQGNDCADFFNLLPLPGGNPENVVPSSGTYGWVKNVAYDFKDAGPKSKTRLKVFNMAKTSMPQVWGGFAPLDRILALAVPCVVGGLAGVPDTLVGFDAEGFDDVRQIDLSSDYVDVLPAP